MSEPSWKPLFRTPKSTVTKVLRSPSFLHSRELAGKLIEQARALRGLADLVEALNHDDAPLSSIADRVAAAVRFLRDKADQLDAQRGSPQPAAGTAARERLLVAALHYLVTPDDLVPDFKPGGYIDDVLLLSWVFGAASHELERFLTDAPPAEFDF